MEFLIKGLIIGFSIAAPVGPIGVLCIKRSLVQGRLSGLLSGLGAATADAMYGVVAAFGLTGVSGYLVAHSSWLQIGGAAFLLFLGLKTFREQSATLDNYQMAPSSRLRDVVSTFVLTISNPLTIISFAAVFSGLGLVSSGEHASAVVLVAGVFLGSAAWWLVLSQSIGLFRSRLNAAVMDWINRVAGIFLMGMAVFIALNLVTSVVK